MLRDDFEDMLREFGHNILLVRQDSLLRCSCWSEKNQEAPRDCPVCFGLGRVPVIEKHTVRSMTQQIPQTLSRAIDEGSSVGPMQAGSTAYFVKVDMKVRARDLIIEVDWSPTGKPIYNGGHVGEVNYVDLKRYENGTPTFQKLYVEEKPVRKEIRGIRVANSNGIQNYEIVRG